MEDKKLEMENSQRNFFSFRNMDISDIFLGSSYSLATNFLVKNRRVPNQSNLELLKTSSFDYLPPDFGTLSKDSLGSDGNKMSNINHDGNEDDDKKKSNKIIDNISGFISSFANMISKIPNAMSSVNNTLSVTVAPNQSIISSEYLVKNLTGNDGIMLNLKDIKNNKKHKNNQYNYNNSNNSMSNYFNHYYYNCDYHDNYYDLDEKYQLDEFFENLKPTKMSTTQQSKTISSDINSIDNFENLDEKYNVNKLLLEKNIIKQKLIISSNNLTDCDKIIVLLIRKMNLYKLKRKKSVNIQKRGKSRNKYQLRKSGVSQLKHKKQKNKQNIYTCIKDDLNALNDDKYDECVLNGIFTNDDKKCRYVTDKKHNKEAIIVNGDDNDDEDDDNDDEAEEEESEEDEDEETEEDEDENDILNHIIDHRVRLSSHNSNESDDSCLIVFENESEDDSEFESDTTDSNDDISYDEIVSFDDEKHKSSGHKVRFNTHPVVHTMVQWDFAYRAARKGPWEEMARDRDRFKTRINNINRIVGPILANEHRKVIWLTRFAEIE